MLNDVFIWSMGALTTLLIIMLMQSGLKMINRIFDTDKLIEYWIDSKGNKWSISKYSEEELLNAHMTLQGCIAYMDCTDCINSRSCTKRQNCYLSDEENHRKIIEK